MPRKGPPPKRPVIIDPVHNSPIVTSLINKVLLDGKRSTAERIVYGALEGCKEKPTRLHSGRCLNVAVGPQCNGDNRIIDFRKSPGVTCCFCCDPSPKSKFKPV